MIMIMVITKIRNVQEKKVIREIKTIERNVTMKRLERGSKREIRRSEKGKDIVQNMEEKNEAIKRQLKKSCRSIRK